MLAVAEVPERADRIYDALPGALGGKVLGTDVARGLLPEYQVGDGSITYNEVTAPVASAYAQDRLWRMIEGPSAGSSRVLRFTAGGPGAGKSLLLTRDALRDVALAYDSNLRKPELAIQLIDHGLRNGWQIQIEHLTRPMDLVFEGIISRARGTGRTAPVSLVPERHYASQRTILELRRRFEEEARVSIRTWLNDGRADPPGRMIEISPEELAPGGAYALSPEQVQAYARRARWAVETSGLPPELKRKLRGAHQP